MQNLGRYDGQMTRFALLVVPFVLLACSKPSDAPAPAPSVAPSASAAPVAVSDKVCPAGSKGKGTSDDPCTTTGRLILAKWTGQNKKASIFTVKNTTVYAIDFENIEVYYYDAAGKQLTVTEKWNPKYPDKMWTGSGGEFDIGPNETKQVEFGWDVKDIPKGTKTIEAEISRVGWTPAGMKDEMYWENDAIDPADRKPGG